MPEPLPLTFANLNPKKHGCIWEALAGSPLACRARVDATPAIGRRGRPRRAQTQCLPHSLPNT